MKKIYTTFGVIIIAILGLTGLAVTHQSSVSAQNNVSSQYLNQAFQSKAATFRLTLNSLLKEHTVMGATMLEALYKGENTTRLEQLMTDNENKLAAGVQNIYGSSAKDQFTQLWTAHMNEYKNYTIARKNNDTKGMNSARNNLKNIANNLGALFAGQSLSSTTVSALMMDHINGTLNFVDAVASNDATQKANLMKQGYDQAGKFADTLTKGIILDKPQLF